LTSAPTAEATSYKEFLDSDDELVPNEALLALNGVKMLEHRRFKLKAKETGQEVDAMQTINDDPGILASLTILR